MSDLRVAVVGFGLAGRVFHAPLVAATPGLTVSAVVTSNAERQAEARALCPGAAVLPDVDALLAAAGDHDVAVVATTTVTHGPVACALLDAGLPVVVDKPLALTAEDATAIVDRAAQRGLLCTVFQNRRWDSDHLTLLQLLGAGEVGEALRYESRFERWRPDLDTGKWREVAAPAEGGGVLLDLGSHLVDQALTLFGPAETVYAEVAARRGGAGDDDAFLALRHAGGVVSHLWTGAVTAAPGPRLRVLGTRGAYVVDRLDGQEEALREGRTPGSADWGSEPPHRWGRLVRGDDVTTVPSERGRWDLFYAGVAEALRGGGPPPVDPRDAVRTLEILDAARRSAADRVVVTP